jgi:hypothetical protein
VISSPTTTPPGPTIVTVRPNGIIVGSDGAMVDPSQYDQFAVTCQMAGRPTPEFAGGVCDAWWVTYDKLAASDDGGTTPNGSAIWASVLALDVAHSFFGKYGGDLAKTGSVDLRITWVLEARQMYQGALPNGSGMLLHLSIHETATGNLLTFAGKTVFAITLVLTVGTAIDTQFDRDRDKNIDPAVGWVRAGGRAAADVSGGIAGGLAAVGLVTFFGGCEGFTVGLGTPVCLAIVAGAGGFVGSNLANAGTDVFYDWLDAEPRWQVDWSQ